MPIYLILLTYGIVCLQQHSSQPPKTTAKAFLVKITKIETTNNIYDEKYFLIKFVFVLYVTYLLVTYLLSLFL